MSKQRGFTLIEMIVFILVLAITASASLLAYTNILAKSNQPGKILAASQLAHARMAIILQQRLVNGFASITDPCTAGVPPAACTGLAAFATSGGYVVTSSIPAAAGGVQTATITITGSGNSTVVMRFVQ